MDSNQENAPETNLKHVKCIIAIAAGKGGVGKSTVSANLALAFSRAGYRVGIMDADVYGPSLRKMLPETALPAQNAVDAERIVPALSGDIKVISMAYFRTGEDAVVVRAPIANGVIQKFLHLVDWGELDYLFIDFPPGTGDIQLTLLQQGTITGALLVTTPQEVALLDVRKAMQMFVQMQIPIVGVVENMSYFEEPSSGLKHFPFGKNGGRRLADEFGAPFLGEIPLDPILSACGDKGESIFQTTDCSAAKVFESLADQVEEQLLAMRSEEGQYLKSFDLAWKEIDD